MKTLTVGIFGNKDFVRELAKESTINDIGIYHHSDSNHSFTFVRSESEKIQSLLQTLQMTEVPLLIISEMTPQIGEEIVGINEMNFKNGIVILDNFPEDQYKKLISGTCLENFKIIEKSVSKIYEELESINIERSDKLISPIDNFFAVKGVGNVILSIIKSGNLKKYDKLFLEPIEKEVTVKSIQIQDKTFDEAGPGSRVGLCLKGVDIKDMKRGQILSEVKQEKTKLLSSFEKNKFYKTELKESEQVIVSSGLQCVTGFIKNNTIELDKEIVAQKPIIIASTKQESLRIIGNGKN
ncbi:EF-Tu/IF-2/RF-3 family GTPase [Candidatus Aenigmatarchaeota archaeon]